MTTLKFWKDAVERSIKTGAQTILSIVVVGDGILNAFTLDYSQIAGVGIGGVMFSLLTSIASSAVSNDHTTASVLRSPKPTIIERNRNHDDK